MPRHPQRFDAVAALIAGPASRCRGAAPGADAPPADAAPADVWLGDSMLEMPAWYALADVALLGGSFAPLGGQNLIEAAACGCPVVMGPHTFNFADAAELALAAGAAIRVATIEEGVAAALRRCGQGDERRQRSDAGLAFAAAHRGAAARMAEAHPARGCRAPERRCASARAQPRSSGSGLTLALSGKTSASRLRAAICR